MIEGRERFDMGLVMPGVVVLGVVGYAINRLAACDRDAPRTLAAGLTTGRKASC